MIDLIEHSTQTDFVVDQIEGQIGLHFFASIMEDENRRLQRNLERARKRGLAATLTLAEWLWVLNYYRYRCAYCREPYDTIDHVNPLSHGGGTEMGNVVPCCDACNKERAQILDKMKRTREQLQTLAARFVY